MAYEYCDGESCLLVICESDVGFVASVQLQNGHIAGTVVVTSINIGADDPVAVQGQI